MEKFIIKNLDTNEVLSTTTGCGTISDKLFHTYVVKEGKTDIGLFLIKDNGEEKLLEYSRNGDINYEDISLLNAKLENFPGDNYVYEATPEYPDCD